MYKKIKNTDYLIHDNGTVTNGDSKELSLSDDGRGYLKITLRISNKNTTFKIHRLVAESFLPNPHNLPVVNHRDGDKTNNNVSNLEWTSHKENSNHYVRLNGPGKIRSVCQLDEKGPDT